MVRISSTPSRERDPNVVLPRDAKTTIKRGRAEHLNATRDKPSRPKKATSSSAILSIIDPEDHRRREKRLIASRRRAKGRRGQPPMTEKLRATAIYVDHLERQGVPFSTARKSRMNRLVRKWLNDGAAKTEDARKSRRKQITADGVRALLKKVDELRH